MKRTSRHTAALGAVSALALLLGACSTATSSESLPAAEIPDEVNPETVLRIGDPRSQAILEAAGLLDDLEFTPEFANIDGGPKTLEAFRADALDVGAVADIPPLFAAWTGEDVRVVAARRTVDPLEHPTYELGIAPGVAVNEISDLAGKKIAYSPGQAQGALVLRVLQEAGLSQEDVELVEIQSTDDVFANALAGGQVDVAPLGIAQVQSYLAKYERDGAASIPPGVPDDPWHLYVPSDTLADPQKSAALRNYVEVWNQANEWINDNRDDYARLYLVEEQGLSGEDAQYVVNTQGNFEIPETWDDLIATHQATADLLATEQGHPELDLNEFYDRRFEPVNLTAEESSGSPA